MEIKQSFLKNNDCYKTGRTIQPAGIVVHSTGCNQKKIAAFTTQWNRPNVSVCVHAFIGLDADRKLKVMQTLPWNHRAWGCGSGKKGSYNNSHIQIEICEDNLTDSNYFTQVYQLAIELCAYLCKEYQISVDNITDHCDAYKAGYASNHADVMHWFPRHKKNMDSFRSDIKKILEPKKAEWIQEKSRWWYRSADGYMVTGWIDINGEWYYLNPISDGTRGSMKTGWIKDNDDWYYCNSKGVMITGWHILDWEGKKSWYYFEPVAGKNRGHMYRDAWLYYKNDYYYFHSDGSMAVNKKIIWNGREFRLDEDGKCLNPTPVFMS